jgi:hypothetical protein
MLQCTRRSSEALGGTPRLILSVLKTLVRQKKNKTVGDYSQERI